MKHGTIDSEVKHMNFNGYSCPKCGNAVTRNKRHYKCRCGWSYREKPENYLVQLRKRLEQKEQ